MLFFFYSAPLSKDASSLLDVGIREGGSLVRCNMKRLIGLFGKLHSAVYS